MATEGNEASPPPGTSRFRTVATTQAEEDAFDYVKNRELTKPTGVIGSIAHVVKGALGGGILGGHVSYLKAGWMVAVPLNILFGMYMCYCLYLLVQSAQILYKRTRITTMSYPEVGEAAVACFPNPKIARCAKLFRYSIDATISIDLFGACACYQLIIAKSIKQLIENTHETSMAGKAAGYPSLRMYMAIMIVPIILICLITHLKWLAPFSIAANFVILLAIFVTVYYSTQNNPTFSNMETHTNFYNTLEFCGMIVFSMSCAGVVIPIENSMREPHKFTITIIVGMTLIVLGTVLVSFFGYAGYLEKSDAPITVNFPMTTLPKILKGLIAVMIYVTHALNFWPPFNICFHYVKKCHKSRLYMWELIYRAIFVVGVAAIAIVFPNISGLMGFLGTFCLSNMAFVWPNVINLLVIWHRPGLGKYYWKLWHRLILIIIGLVIWVCGSIVNTAELLSVFF